jgi:hypothetical protein
MFRNFDASVNVDPRQELILEVQLERVGPHLKYESIQVGNY